MTPPDKKEGGPGRPPASKPLHQPTVQRRFTQAGNGPPHSIELEAVALGALLADPEHAQERAARLRLGLFYDLRHRAALEAGLTAGAFDSVTLFQRLKTAPWFEKAGGAGWLAALADRCPTPTAFDTYLPELEDMAHRRALLDLARKAEALAMEPEADPAAAARDFADLAAGLLAGPSEAPTAQPLAELRPPDEADGTELLRHRFLCRGAGLLLAGPTGTGKSALLMQAAICWAIGEPVFEIHPARPLKTLLIQAENDTADLAAMRDGVGRGLDLSAEQRSAAFSRIFICRETRRTGEAFFREVARPLLAAHRPDLLLIDPALAFIGGEVGRQDIVGPWLRNMLAPLLDEFSCAAVIAHHTNKPPSGREKPDWRAGDLAYLGAGSAEWANWPRAVLSLRSIGEHGRFELHAAKRGAQIGWRNPDDTTAFSKFVGHWHEPGVICWRELTLEEAPGKPGRPTGCDAKDLLDLLPPGGLSTEEWQLTAENESGISRRSFFRLKKTLLANGEIRRDLVSGKIVKKAP